MPATWNTKGTGRPASVSTSRSGSPARRWNRWARVNETLTSPGRAGSARRPERIFLFQKPPGIALPAGAMNSTMPGVTPNDLITAASAAWGTRITAVGESRGKIGLYGSAKTRASGALLQSRKRAYAEPVRSAPAAAVTTPPAKTPTISARDSQARQRRRDSARRNSQIAVTGRHRPACPPAGRSEGWAVLHSYANLSGARQDGQ